MSVSTSTTLSLIKFLYSNKLYLFMLRYDHLGDTLTIVYDEILIRKIDKEDAHLTTVVGINSTRAVKHSNTFFQSQSATRSNLCLKTLRQCDIQSRRYEPALHRAQYHRLFKISAYIHSGTHWRSILRQLLVSFVYNLHLCHVVFGYFSK